MTSRRLTAMTLAAITALALAGCTGSEDPTPTGTTQTTTASPATTTPDPVTQDAGTTEPEPDAIPECDGLVLEDGAVLDGEILADCMSAAMVTAGSGSQLLTMADGTTTVDFEWTPELALHATGEAEYVIRGDDGWLLEDGKWVEADSSSADADEAEAGAVIELSGAFGDPRGLVMLLSQTGWDVVGQEEVPVEGAVADSGWLLTPQSPMTLLGVTLSDVRLWIGPDYLGIYFVGTGQFSSVDETTSSTFTQWGEPVEIPDPGAA